MVPAWKEGNIIARMLKGNLERIDYQKYHIFVGVYPNDTETVEQVKRVSEEFPNVHAVVNYKNGPTSKGQILNYVVEQILCYERKNGIEFDAFLMQDAEDLIHPKILKLVNAKTAQFDFVQVPVFSLEVKPFALVAGTYVDEFAESHTKDLLVRDRLGSAVPSAGVGTALSRRLVVSVLEKESLFFENTVTEDYELGVRAHQMGFKPHFAAYSYKDSHTKKVEYIATREFFPKHFTRSVRQKTRWSVGICIQSWGRLGWIGNIRNRYFLWRDRKGILTNIASLVGYFCLGLALLYALVIDDKPLHAFLAKPLWTTLFEINLALMINRFFQRLVCVYRVYGVKACWLILLRWPVGICINALASFSALKNGTLAYFKKASIVWVKTEHELPSYFGSSVPG
jgi:adsorption protein B